MARSRDNSRAPSPVKEPPDGWRVRIILVLLGTAATVGGALAVDKYRSDKQLAERVQRGEDTHARAADLLSLERSISAEVRKIEQQIAELRLRLASIPNHLIDGTELKSRLDKLDAEVGRLRDEIRDLTLK